MSDKKAPLDPVELEKLWHQQLEQADAAQPVVVKAQVRNQMGKEILVANCPRCTHVMALSGEGRQICRGCHLWLKFVREA